MNNWRLLLLALAAVFQPITSFTDRNLVDGRQQCCGQLSSPLRDTRSSFHGIHEKTTTASLRRLNDRDEIHHDRRNEIRQRDSLNNLPLTERRLLDTRASGSRLSANRVESRLDNRLNEHSRDRLVDVHEKEIVRYRKSEHLTYRAVDRGSRSHATQDRHNDRTFETSRDRTFRNFHRTERYGNERQSKNSFDSQREIPELQIRSGGLRITLNTDARHILRQSTNKESRIGAAKNMNNRPRNMRERLSEVRYETLVRTDFRRNNDNSHERQQLERNTEQIRSLSENTPLVHQFRDMRIRINFRDENREHRQRLFVERLGVRYEQRYDRRESRQHNKENTERLQIARRITRETRISSIISNPVERNIYGQQEMGHEQMMRRESRDEIKANPGHKLSREIIQMDRRNNRGSKIMSTFNTRDDDNRREYRNNERKNTKNLLESIQMERTHFRDFRVINVITRNYRDIGSTSAIRHKNRLSKETRYAVKENSDQGYSRDQLQQSNIRELRIVNTPNKSNVDGQRQINYNEKRSTEIRRELKDNNPRLPSEMNRRGLEIRPEIRRERLSREIRDGISRNSHRRVIREKRQVDRTNICKSRIIIIGMNTGNAIESKREIRYNDRLSRHARDHQFARVNRVESRTPGRVTVTTERESSLSDRRTRSADSQNFRQVRTEPLSRSAERRSEAFRSRVEHGDRTEHREREATEARSRNVELARNRESIASVMVRKVDPENDSIVGNWQYLLYTLQAAYVCTLFMQILTPSRSEQPKKLNLRWLRVSSHYNPIKVD